MDKASAFRDNAHAVIIGINQYEDRSIPGMGNLFFQWQLRALSIWQPKLRACGAQYVADWQKGGLR
jgi:hypothetical protein